MELDQPTLLVIDAQRGFDDPRWGPRNNPAAEERIAELLHGWRTAGAPLIHVRHESRHPNGFFRRGAPGFEFKAEATPLPNEDIVNKHVNSAFIGTDLEARLRRQGSNGVVICGFTTDHCCSTTARMAANLGFTTSFVADATATFDRRDPWGGVFTADLIHHTSLASLNEEFARILWTVEALRLVEPQRARPEPAGDRADRLRRPVHDATGPEGAGS